MYDLATRVSHSDKGFRVLNGLGLPRGDISQTVVLAGSPRSGTTWLAELLSTMPDYTLLDEPLHLRWPAVKETGIDEWRPYVDKKDDCPSVWAYMERALSGRVACNRQFQSQNQISKLYELLAGKKNIVKFVRANRMLNWMAAQFEVRGIVLMLRHPCAVVASQLKYKRSGWRRTEPPPPSERQEAFGGWIPDEVFTRFEPVLAEVDSTAARLAAVWCLDTYFPLREAGSFPGIITTYEGLLTRQEQEVTRIFKALGSEMPAQALQSFNEHSYSASQDLRTEDIEAQLGKWRKKLDSDQVDDVLRIVERFGLDFYSEKLEPDYEALISF